MAKESDGEERYKEGVDFEWVPMENQSEDSDVKVRHFFTRAEKEARKNPKPAAPKAAAPKAKPKAATPKAKPKAATPAKPTSAVRPEGKPAGMPGAKKSGSSAIPILAVGAAAASTGKGGPRRNATKGPYNPRFGSGKPGPTGFQGKYQTGVSQNSRGSGGRAGMILGQDPMFNALGGGGFGALEDIRDDALLQYKKGGVVKMKEGSAKDMREDKAMAKKSGMSMKKWEKSAADKKHDAPKKMAGGGIVRGAGAAIRGKRYMGEC